MFHYPPTNSHKEKQKIGRQNDNCIYEIKLSNPSQFAGQLITICQAVHLIMSQLSQKQMFPKPTNATIIISTLTSSNYFMQCSSLKISTYCPVRKNQHLSLAKCKLHCILKKIRQRYVWFYNLWKPKGPTHSLSHHPSQTQGHMAKHAPSIIKCSAYWVSATGVNADWAKHCLWMQSNE